MTNKDTINVIIKSFHEKKNSHAFLFNTNNVEKTYKDVLEIIKEINSEGKSAEFIEKLNRTIDDNTNPDVYTIKTDKREILVDEIYDLLDRFSTTAFMNSYKTYIIYDADKLSESSSNKLLKFLEEPEENIVGFYLTAVPNKILSTIRSRCEIFNFEYNNNNILDLLDITEEYYNNYYDITTYLINILNDNTKYKKMINTKKISSYDRNQMESILMLLKKIYELKFDNVLNNSNNNAEYAINLFNLIDENNIYKLSNRIKIINDAIIDVRCNVNRDLSINKMFIKWE
ncbi:MAG TPA: hypothetical protein PLB45_00070 [Bacilli bacterium]|nr:hypothetical protein [Bacilli bacterium]HQC83257.1 hypothetical protein [Bacilli bacterium]